MLVAVYVTRLQRKQLGGQKRHWSFLVKGFLLNTYGQKEDFACDLTTEFLKKLRNSVFWITGRSNLSYLGSV